MKKKLWVLGLTMMFLIGMTTTVYAGESVEFTEQNELKLSNTDLGAEFQGMAPGEVKSQTITIVNRNINTADFYVKTEALQELERKNQASGGTYKIMLELVQGDIRRALYDSSLGGASTAADGTITTNTEGILGLNASEIGSETTFLTTLKRGQTAELVMTVGLDGESIRNAEQNTYAVATGTLGMEFLVAYREPITDRIVTVNKVVTQSSVPAKNVVQTFKQVVVGVKTGDSSLLGVFIGILAVGAVLVVITGKKEKTEEPHEIDL